MIYTVTYVFGDIGYPSKLSKGSGFLQINNVGQSDRYNNSKCCYEISFQKVSVHNCFAILMNT